ncbi:MAG: RluA family pseudouridine synthase [Bdellovibrionales bacterium]
MPDRKIEILVEASQLPIRIDRYLSTLPEIGSRSRADHLISHQRILLNGKLTKSSQIIKPGDRVEISLPLEKKRTLEPYAFPLDIKYEDSHLLVINKPAGLVVHPAAGHESDTLVNALLNHTQDLSMKFNEERPGIVHRIDKETSGLLVVAKNDFSHEKLVKQFQERTIRRIYKAVCYGEPQPSSGRRESNIGRHPVDRKRMASVENGKWAATNYWKTHTSHGLSMVTLKLETGRTHQIRVHMSEMGHPLVGDYLYGSQKKIKSIKSSSVQNDIRSLGRFLLHAEILGFSHPQSNEWLEFSVDWPAQDKILIKKWGLDEL